MADLHENPFDIRRTGTPVIGARDTMSENLHKSVDPNKRAYAHATTPISDWVFDEEKAEDALHKVITSWETAMTGKRTATLDTHDLVWAVYGPYKIQKMKRKPGDPYVPVSLMAMLFASSSTEVSRYPRQRLKPIRWMG